MVVKNRNGGPLFRGQLSNVSWASIARSRKHQFQLKMCLLTASTPDFTENPYFLEMGPCFGADHPVRLGGPVLYVDTTNFNEKRSW